MPRAGFETQTIRPLWVVMILFLVAFFCRNTSFFVFVWGRLFRCINYKEPSSAVTLFYAQNLCRLELRSAISSGRLWPCLLHNKRAKKSRVTQYGINIIIFSIILAGHKRGNIGQGWHFVLPGQFDEHMQHDGREPVIAFKHKVFIAFVALGIDRILARRCTSLMAWVVPRAVHRPAD